MEFFQSILCPHRQAPGESLQDYSRQLFLYLVALYLVALYLVALWQLFLKVPQDWLEYHEFELLLFVPEALPALALERISRK